MADPIGILLSGSRMVGGDYCWPATKSLDVIHSLAELSRVILGVELWRFEESEAPEVVGWSDYRIDLSGSWGVCVEMAERLATDSVLGFSSDQDLWVNVTWEDPPGGPNS